MNQQKLSISHTGNKGYSEIWNFMVIYEGACLFLDRWQWYIAELDSAKWVYFIYSFSYALEICFVVCLNTGFLLDHYGNIMRNPDQVTRLRNSTLLSVNFGHLCTTIHMQWVFSRLIFCSLHFVYLWIVDSTYIYYIALVDYMLTGATSFSAILIQGFHSYINRDVCFADSTPMPDAEHETNRQYICPVTCTRST